MARARSEQRAENAHAILEERTARRHEAVQGIEQFSATGLLAIALPELALPPTPWTIEPALQVARGAEQLLLEVDAEDADWSRVQSAYARDFSDLQTALTALGHQGQAEPSDHGMIVTIIYQNRPQRPDLIEAAIRAEITQRQELLTARETEVLENHLQAEVAAAIQRRLQEADRRVATINTELEKRPTSTGVRFRLLWQALEEGSEGAPVGLDAARKRLLNTSYDAWSAEDRQVVGRLLQNRIAAERGARRCGPQQQSPRIAGSRARLPALAPVPRAALAGRPMAAVVRPCFERRARAGIDSPAVRGSVQFLYARRIAPCATPGAAR